MLVLGRRAGESVIIGDEIVVTILAVDGEKIKIGIQAPSDTRILRQELYDSVKEENLRAADRSAQLGDLLPSLVDLLQKKSDS
ncbi:MAG: carbon storage regulator CsrA [Anaerolineae bacterium]|nr:carbon storage regulator CsrA [Anaerolineae bacterium]